MSFFIFLFLKNILINEFRNLQSNIILSSRARLYMSATYSIKYVSTDSLYDLMAYLESYRVVDGRRK